MTKTTQRIVILANVTKYKYQTGKITLQQAKEELKDFKAEFESASKRISEKLGLNPEKFNEMRFLNSNI